MSGFVPQPILPELNDSKSQNRKPTGKLMPINRSKISGASPVLFYLFFLVHMAIFGIGCLYMSYSDGGKSSINALLFSIFPLYVYIKFYLVLFGLDDIRWLFINSALGFFGIFAQLDFILYLFDATVDDYPGYVHIAPFIYFILYTFLIRHALLDLIASRFDKNKQRLIENTYIATSIIFYTFIGLL